MKIISVHPEQIQQTLRGLQIAGESEHECVVLWLGMHKDDKVEIREVYRPRQTAHSHYFRILPDAMAELMKHLRQTRYFIAAQVHSHPEEAFHSDVDDDWAIVRHEGALSLVLPYFAMNTDKELFVQDAAVFQLSKHNQWIEVPPSDVENSYIIEP